MTTIRSLVRSIKEKKLKPYEAIKRSLDRIEKEDGDINAFVHVEKDALKHASNLDETSDLPLLGVPISIKDMICVRGMPTTACSKILKNFVPSYSATLVEHLISKGAIIVGKANCDEFAMGSCNETSCFGPVKNPWNKDYVAGGSSGGSAASVASKMVLGSIGTDTGGSIRQPSSFCGVVGLKPTYGRVSRFGVLAFASSLDQAGPIAGNVEDVALLAKIISGYDPKDSKTSKIKVGNWDQAIDTKISGLTVGVLSNFDVSPEVAKAILKTKQILKDQGCKLIDVNLSNLKYAVATYYLICTSEASSNLSRYDGIRYGLQLRDSLDFVTKTRSKGLGNEVKLRIILGSLALSSGYFEDYYLKACKVRRLIKNDFDSCFEKCSVILSPVTSGLPYKLKELTNKLELYSSDLYTVSSNLAGLPSLSLPIYKSSQNLPVGIQLIANRFNEQTLFNMGKAIEEIC